MADTALRCVLFDLDGTLVDTAPDLVAAVNFALGELGLPRQPAAALKPMISGGAAAMLRHALGRAYDASVLDRLLPLTLDWYEQHVADQSKPFAGVESMLNEIERRGLRWGIVTNKIARFTDVLMAALDLGSHPGCVISGDTTEAKKPHPRPLLEACRRLNTAPAAAVYIGDARRDIEAGQRAGMATLAAVYGYVAADDDPGDWGADGLVETPRAVLEWVRVRS